MKWQGLNVSRRPTDGQPSPNPGEEALRCNKVQNSYSGQLLSERNSAMKPVYISLLNVKSKRESFTVSVQVLRLLIKLQENIIFRDD